MSKGSRKSGSNHRRKARTEGPPKPMPCRKSRLTPDQLRAIIPRKDQDVIHRELLARHGYDIPVPKLFTLRAVRLEQAVTGG